MTHHGHSVERRLSVEENHVAIHQVAIDCVTVVQNNFARVHVRKRDHTPIGAYERLGTRVLGRSVLNELVKLVAIVVSHALRNRQVHGDLDRYTKLRN